METVFDKKKVWALILPLVAEQLLSSLMGTADTMMVTSAGGAAVSAVSLVDALNMLIIQLFSAMAVGGTVVVAQHVGRQDLSEAREDSRQLLLSVTLMAAVLGLLCFVLRRPLLRLLYGGVEEAVMREALDYLAVTSLSFPFLALYSAAAAVFRCAGNSRLPTVISIAANLLNVAGNALLIFGFRMRALGVAIPTLVSRILCGVVTVYFLRDERNRIPVRGWLKAKLSRKRVTRILKVGIPNGVENSMFQFGKLVIQTVVAGMGTAAIAANAITAALEGISGIAAVGLGMALTTIVAVCMGAGRRDEAKHWIYYCTGWSEAAILVFSLAMIAVAKPVTRLISLEPEAAGLAVTMTVVTHCFKPLFWSMGFIPAYGMRGAGDVRFSMIVSSSTMWLCRVAVSVILAKTTNIGPLAVWIGMASDWGVRGLIYMLRLRSGRWAEQKVL